MGDPRSDPAAGGEKRLKTVSASPPNAEAPARATYRRWLTPTEEFFVRSHYPAPDLDASSWEVRLRRLDGSTVDLAVERLRTSYPTRTVVATMACAGLGRASFQPPAKGVQWTFGAVGTARWTGAPVADVLERAGASTDDDLWLTVVGADAPEGEDLYARSIPMSKILDDCLLAYRMNGEPLPPDHGHPVRLVVPGWYGCNSVKWVDEMIVTDGMIGGAEGEEYDEGSRHDRWQQRSYRLVPHGGGDAHRHRTISHFDLWDQMASDEIECPYMYEQPVHSLIAVPEPGAELRLREGDPVEIVGVAWAGDTEVDVVEVSVDGGRRWREAELFGPDEGPSAWRRFRCRWRPAPGAYEVVSRATDARGRRQPAEISGPGRTSMTIENDVFPANERGYGNNAYRTYAVDVTVSRPEGSS